MFECQSGNFKIVIRGSVDECAVDSERGFLADLNVSSFNDGVMLKFVELLRRYRVANLSKLLDGHERKSVIWFAYFSL